MARLNSNLVTHRELTAYKAFQGIPQPSVSEVQEILKKKDNGGMEMAIGRIYAIRDAARDGKPIPKKVSKGKKAAKAEQEIKADEPEMLTPDIGPDLDQEVALLMKGRGGKPQKVGTVPLRYLLFR